MKLYFAALAAALSLFPAAAQAQNTTKLTATKAGDYGVVYTLPKTEVDVVIETEYSLTEPGEYYNYARRYLGLTDAARAPKRTASVKSVTLVPRGVPDAESRWTMQFKGQGVTCVVLNAAGVPVAINTEDIPATASPVLPQARAAAPTPLETEAAAQAVTREMTQSSSLQKRAELAAQRIFELREYRNDLVTGQADNTPQDGKWLELALKNIGDQEAALTAMFAGTTKTWTSVDRVTFTPDTTAVEGMVIARLSPIDGIVPATDLSGEPITLSMTIAEQGRMPVDADGKTLPFPKGGVAYNIPGQAVIAVQFRGRTLATATVDVTQLGTVYGVDPKVFTNKKAPAFMLFDPATGGLLNLGTKEQQ